MVTCFVVKSKLGAIFFCNWGSMIKKVADSDSGCSVKLSTKGKKSLLY